MTDRADQILEQQSQILQRLSSIEEALSCLATGKGRATTAADEILLGAADPLELIKEQNARRLKQRGIKTKNGRRVK